MIRLTAWPFDDSFAFTVTRDGVDLFTTVDGITAAEHLIEAARQWGVVEIREPGGAVGWHRVKAK